MKILQLKYFLDTFAGRYLIYLLDRRNYQTLI